MIVGVDARELEGKPTGVGNYLLNVLERLSLRPGVSLRLYFKNEIPAKLDGLPYAEKILLRSLSSHLYWQQWHLSRELTRRKVPLFFSPNGSCPWFFSGIQALTVHDLSFFRYPRWFSLKERLSRQLNTSLSVRQADRVYVDTHYVRQELISLLNVPQSRILVTGIGVNPKKNDSSVRSLLRRSYGLEQSRIVLYVGSIFNRRHLPVLIEAFGKLDPDCVLVIIGENRTYPHQDLGGMSRKLGLENRFRLLEYVSEKVVQDYYQMADVFVYLSAYEGFGIPPLEAMSYGIPVVLSETPAMDKIYEGAGYFVKSIISEEVAAAIRHCLEDPRERARLSQAGIALANRHSWEETVRLISEDWEQLLAAGR